VVSVVLGWVSVVVSVVARGLPATSDCPSDFPSDCPNDCPSDCPNDCPRCRWSYYAAVYHVPPANCGSAPESELITLSDVVSQTRAMAVTQSKYFSRLEANDSMPRLIRKLFSFLCH